MSKLRDFGRPSSCCHVNRQHSSWISAFSPLYDGFHSVYFIFYSLVVRFVIGNSLLISAIRTVFTPRINVVYA